MNDLTSSADKPKERIPLIAIVGRPNVGKSTLFNRLVGKRKSITDPTPGVTRDPIEEIYEIEGRTVRLVDTGGYKAEGDQMDDLVSKKCLEIVRQADLILLMMDVEEVTPEDEIFMESMRPYTNRILLVVNKVDNPKREENFWNFFSYGFPNVMGVSSAHGLNVAELEEKVVELMDELHLAGELPESLTDPVDIRLSIMGKPNTGKSTLINQLTGLEKSIVSDIPGTTRDVVEGAFNFNDTYFKVLDTAGIRRKKVINQDVEYYSVNRSIKSIEESDVVLLMIDSLEGLADQDKKIAQLIVKKGKGVILVLNKWDLQEDVVNLKEAVEDRVRFLFPILGFAPIVHISALTGDGVENLLNRVLRVWSQLNTKIETPQLNKALEAWVDRYAPPMGKKIRYKVRYITQIRSNPHHFVLFVNKIKGFPQDWITYCKNRIREDFQIGNVPIKMELR